MNANNISKFTLGTVQLGVNYGMANKSGKPSEQESFGILDTALSCGVTSFDTASHYGDSEKVVGDWMRSGDKNAFTVSKFKLYSDEPLKELEDQIKTSEERLGKIGGYMYHDADQMRKWHPTVKDRLERMKEENNMLFCGASVYTAEDVEDFLEIGTLGAIQIPMSVLDTRLIERGLLKELQKKGVLVFVRSIFLQGMLCMDTLPEKFDFMKPSIDLLREVAAAEDMSLMQLAVSFIRDLPEVTSLVLGCEKKEQVMANAELVKGKALSESAVKEILEIGKKVPMGLCMDIITGKVKR